MKIKTITSNNIPSNLQPGETMFETDTNQLLVHYGDRLFIFRPDTTRDIVGSHEDLHYPNGIYSDSSERYYITTAPVVHFDASHYDGINRTFNQLQANITTWTSRSQSVLNGVYINTDADNSTMLTHYETADSMPGIIFDTQSPSIPFSTVEEIEDTSVDVAPGDDPVLIDSEIPYSFSVDDVDDCTMIMVSQFNNVNPTVGTFLHPMFGTIDTAPWNSIMPFKYDVNNVNNTWNDLITTRGLWDQEVNKWFHKTQTNRVNLTIMTKQSNTRQVRTYFNGLIENNYNWTASTHDFTMDSIHPGATKFYEFMVFDRVLSDVTVNVIVSYLKNKYPLEHAIAWEL